MRNDTKIGLGSLGAAAGALALGKVTAGISLVVTGAMYLWEGLFGKRPEEPGVRTEVTEPDAPLPVIYGERRVGLRIVESTLARNPKELIKKLLPDADASGIDDVDDDDVMIRVGAICLSGENGSSIEGISDIRFNGEPYDERTIDPVVDVTKGFLTTNIKPGITENKDRGDPVIRLRRRLGYLVRLGGDSQYVPVDLREHAEWKDTDKGTGVAYIAFAMYYDEQAYSGVPQVEALVKGVKVWDPRDGDRDSISNWEHSDNPALCILDFIMSKRYGGGLSEDQVDVESFKKAAAYCAESQTVTYPDNYIDAQGNSVTTEPLNPRFSLNYICDTSLDATANLNAMLASCRGSLIWEEGKMRISVRRKENAGGAWPLVVSPLALDEDVVVGGWTWKRLGESVPNVADASFMRRVDHAKGADFIRDSISWPFVNDEDWLEDDNHNERRNSIGIQATVDPLQVVADMAVLAKEMRQDVVSTAICNAKALQWRVEDLVKVTNREAGWINKLFWITYMTMRQDGLVEVGLHEYSAECYDYHLDAQPDDVPGTNKPDPFVVKPPTNLRLTSDSTTSVLYGSNEVPGVLVNWDKSKDPFLKHYVVEWKAGEESDSKIVEKGTTRALVSPVQSVEHDFSVKAVNNLGVESAPVSAKITPGVTPGTDQALSLASFREKTEGRLPGSVTYEWTRGTDVEEVRIKINEIRLSEASLSTAWRDINVNFSPDAKVLKTATQEYAVERTRALQGSGKFVLFVPYSDDDPDDVDNDLIAGPARRILVLDEQFAEDDLAVLEVDVNQANGSVEALVAAGGRTKAVRVAISYGDDPPTEDELNAAEIRPLNDKDKNPDSLVGVVFQKRLELGQTAHVKAKGYANKTGAGDGGDVLSAHVMRSKQRAPTWNIVSQTEYSVAVGDEGIVHRGRFDTVLDDPDDVVSRVEYRTRTGGGSWEDWADASTKWNNPDVGDDDPFKNPAEYLGRTRIPIANGRWCIRNKSQVYIGTFDQLATVGDLCFWPNDKDGNKVDAFESLRATNRIKMAWGSQIVIFEVTGDAVNEGTIYRVPVKLISSTVSTGAIIGGTSATFSFAAGLGYRAEVRLSDKRPSFVMMRAVYELNGDVLYSTIPSEGFDPGSVPNGTVVASILERANFPTGDPPVDDFRAGIGASCEGDFDTEKWRVTAVIRNDEDDFDESWFAGRFDTTATTKKYEEKVGKSIFFKLDPRGVHVDDSVSLRLGTRVWIAAVPIGPNGETGEIQYDDAIYLRIAPRLDITGEEETSSVASGATMKWTSISDDSGGGSRVVLSYTPSSADLTAALSVGKKIRIGSKVVSITSVESAPAAGSATLIVSPRVPAPAADVQLSFDWSPYVSSTGQYGSGALEEEGGGIVAMVETSGVSGDEKLVSVSLETGAPDLSDSHGSLGPAGQHWFRTVHSIGGIAYLPDGRYVIFNAFNPFFVIMQTDGTLKPDQTFSRGVNNVAALLATNATTMLPFRVDGVAEMGGRVYVASDGGQVASVAVPDLVNVQAQGANMYQTLDWVQAARHGSIASTNKLAGMWIKNGKLRVLRRNTSNNWVVSEISPSGAATSHKDLYSVGSREYTGATEIGDHLYAFAGTRIWKISPTLDSSAFFVESHAGSATVKVYDPGGQADSLEFRTKSGASDWTAWEDAVAVASGLQPPDDGFEHTANVSLVENHQSFVQWRLGYVLPTTPSGKTEYVTATSGGMDAGRIPSIISASARFENGILVVSANGDSDTENIYAAVRTDVHEQDHSVLKGAGSDDVSTGSGSGREAEFRFGPYPSGTTAYLSVLASNTDFDASSLVYDTIANVAASSDQNWVRDIQAEWVQTSDTEWGLYGTCLAGPEVDSVGLAYTRAGASTETDRQVAALLTPRAERVIIWPIATGGSAVKWTKDAMPSAIKVTPRAGTTDGDPLSLEVRPPSTGQGQIRVVDQSSVVHPTTTLKLPMGKGLEALFPGESVLPPSNPFPSLFGAVGDGKIPSIGVKTDDFITISEDEPVAPPANPDRPAIWLMPVGALLFRVVQEPNDFKLERLSTFVSGEQSRNDLSFGGRLLGGITPYRFRTSAPFTNISLVNDQYMNLFLRISYNPLQVFAVVQGKGQDAVAMNPYMNAFNRSFVVTFYDSSSPAQSAQMTFNLSFEDAA